MSTPNSRLDEGDFEIEIFPEKVHLAFNCKEPLLQSSAFSSYKRISFADDGSNDVTNPRFRASSATSSRGKRVPASSLREPNQPSSTNASGSTRTTASNPTPTEPIIVDRTGIILDVLIARPDDIDWLIWGGILILEGLDFPAKHPRIAVKLADWERDSEAEVVGNVSETGRVLLKEARVYEYLAQMAPAGAGITPHYYGTFNDSGSIAVILDYGGKRLPSNSLAKLEDSEKQALFAKAQQLHQLGIVHGYLAERNILVDEDRNFTIIDFHDAELGHKCSWNGSDGCHELKLFAGYLDLRL